MAAVLAPAAAVVEHDSASPTAIIAGSAVNQDGRSSSLTAPNGPAQSRLLASALSSGKLRPSAVQAVAVHGTGTPLGDPIEVGALGQALHRHLGSAESAEGPVALPSVKACFGHTEGAAGLTGMLLAACSLGHTSHPAIMNFRCVVAEACVPDMNRISIAKLYAWVPGRRLAVSALHNRLCLLDLLVVCISMTLSMA